jgi:hypothetical protein
MGCECSSKGYNFFGEIRVRCIVIINKYIMTEQEQSGVRSLLRLSKTAPFPHEF